MALTFACGCRVPTDEPVRCPQHTETERVPFRDDAARDEGVAVFVRQRLSLLQAVVAWHDATEAVIVAKLRAGETPTAEDYRAHHLVEQALFYLEAAAGPETWAEAMA